MNRDFIEERDSGDEHCDPEATNVLGTEMQAPVMPMGSESRADVTEVTNVMPQEAVNLIADLVNSRAAFCVEEDGA